MSAPAAEPIESFPTYADVQSACARLEGFVRRTPVLSSPGAAQYANAKSIFFKCENLQRGGSFKIRGAFNSIANLPQESKVKGVITFSSGNHALGISLAAQQLGTPAVIVMPLDAPVSKIEGTRANGARIVFYDRQKGEDREAICRKLAAENGLTIIPPFDYFDVVAGQGTAAKELFESVGELDYLFVCCGGSGESQHRFVQLLKSS